MNQSLRRDTWLRAEASLPKANKVMLRAASALPSRAALILRALDALQRADLPQLHALGAEASSKGFDDLAAALALLAAKPGSQAAKDAIERANPFSVGPCPSLGALLGGVEALRTFSAPPADLAPSAQQPAALRSLLRLLSAEPQHPERDLRLAADLSPRADQVQIAAANLLFYKEVDDVAVESYCARDSVLALDEGGWPDASPEGILALIDWCEDRCDTWTDDQGLGFQIFDSDATPRFANLQRACFAGVLRKTIRILREGKFQVALDPLMDACEFARSSRAFPAALRQQCWAISVRLEWFTDGFPNPFLYQALWHKYRPQIPPSALLEIAQDMAAMPVFPDESEASPFAVLRRDAVCYLIEHLDSLDEIAVKVEYTFGPQDRALLRKHLQAANVSPARAAYALGIHAMVCDHFPQALEHIAPLFKDPASLHLGFDVLEQVLLALRDRDNPLPNSVKAQITEILSGLTKAKLSCPHLLCPRFVTHFKMGPYGLTPLAADLLRSSVQVAISPDDPAYLPQLAAQTATQALLGDDTKAREHLRDLGRALRRLKDDPDPQALTIAGLLSTWLPTEGDLRQTYLEPVTRFILRDPDQARISTAISTLTEPTPVVYNGLLDWYLANRETLGCDEHWRQFILSALDVPEPIKESSADIVDSALAQNPTDSETLLFSVQMLLDKRLNQYNDFDDDSDYEDEDEDDDFDEDDDGERDYEDDDIIDISPEDDDKTSK